MAPLLLRVDPTDPRPIWRQIEEGLLHAIGRGEFAVGSPVPSVRDLARQLRVNPNTVVKVYQHLADQGVVEVRRGEGTFVAGLPPALARRERESSLRTAAELFVARARREGSSPTDITHAVEQALAADAKERKP